MKVTDEQAQMLGGLGYRPGWVKDIRDDDAIMVPETFGEQLHEWVVSGIWDSNRGDGGYIRHFIATAPDGTATPQAFGYEYPLYFKRDDP